MSKKALITGVTGQDGSYLADFLLNQGYQVYGLVRRLSFPCHERIQKALTHDNFELVEGDLSDLSSLLQIMRDIQPDEVYNLGAQSFVGTSWQQPILTGEITALGVTKILEAIRLVCPTAKFYQASSSEMFGKVLETPQTERTPFYPRSPYGVAKVYGHYLTVNYRESYDLFACSGILFNHESPRRGIEFVTKKIAHGVAQIVLDKKKYLELGNLDAQRDWGYAKDYVVAMWLMLQQEKPDDYVVSTGETHSIREFLDIAFKAVDITDWSKYVRHNPKFDRPAEVDLLVGDATKAQQKLGWHPTVTFNELVELMVNAELDLLKGKKQLSDF